MEKQATKRYEFAYGIYYGGGFEIDLPAGLNENEREALITQTIAPENFTKELWENFIAECDIKIHHIDEVKNEAKEGGVANG
jgi:hypothetical protein